jgi:hypothetical protein
MDPDRGSASRVSVSCPPLQYDRRSYTVEKIGVGIGMRGSGQRYRNASCPFDINEIMSVSCLARAAGKVSCLPAGEAYPGRKTVSFCALCIGRDKQYLVRWELLEIA